MFGNGHCKIGGLPAHQHAFIGGRNDDGPLKPRFAEIILNEFLYFTATLTDQTDNSDIAFGVARQHGHQHRLADARACEDAHPLALATGYEGVERAHSQIQWRSDSFTF